MKMQIFENEEFGKVRTLTTEEGKILFCATDVAKMLGYSNPNDAILRHCKGIVKHEGVSFTKNQHGKVTGQMSPMNFIPEPDIYRLIFKSKLEAAERFEIWVVEEVLPTIRKTGVYCMDKETAAIVNYYNHCLAVSKTTNVKVTAKILKIPEKLFRYLLVDMGFVYRNGSMLIPKAEMVNKGYIVLRPHDRINETEEDENKKRFSYIHFTEVGKAYIWYEIKDRFALK